MQRATAPMFSAVELEHLRQGLPAASRQQAPTTHVLSLIGEVGDLAKLFASRSSGGAASQAPLTAQDKADVGQELSAALLQLVHIADACGVDLGRAALDTLAAPAGTQSGLKARPAVRPVASAPPGDSQQQQQQQPPGLHSAPGQLFVRPGALQPPPQQQQQKQPAPPPPPPPLRQQQQQQQQQQVGVQFAGRRHHWEQRSGPAGPQYQGQMAAPLPTPAAAAAAAAAAAGGGGGGGGASAGAVPSSSSVTSISVGLLRQLATLAALNPQAAIDLLTANPAATASLVAAITDPSHPVARVVAAALSTPGSPEAAAGAAGTAEHTPAAGKQAGGRPAAPKPAPPGQPPQVLAGLNAALASASALQQQLGSRLTAGLAEKQQHAQLGAAAAAPAAGVGVPPTPPAGFHTGAGVAAPAGASPTAQLQQQQPVQLQQPPVHLRQQHSGGGQGPLLQHQWLNAQQLRVLAQYACEQGWTSSQAGELAASLGIDAGVLRAVIEGVAAGSAGGSGGAGALPGRGPRGQAAAAAQPRGVKRGLYMS